VGFPGGSDLGPSKQKLLDGSVASAINAGAEVTSVYMQDVDLPFCIDDGEYEDGFPSCAANNRKDIASHHILLVATPERNDERIGPLENAINSVKHVSESAGSRLGRLVSESAWLISRLVSRLDEIRLQIAFRRALVKLGNSAVPDASEKMRASGANIQEKSKCNLE
jgi:NAD(P)H-dependent FMN reductase